MFCDFFLEHWPIVYVKFNDNEIDNESFEEYKKQYLNLLIKCKKNNEKMVLICNLNNAKSLPMDYLVKQGQFNKEIEKFNKDYINFVCILCKDKSFKNILNLYFSMSKPTNPMKICRSFNKINKYLLEKFNINFDTNIFEHNQFSNEIEEEEQEELENNIV